MRCGVLGGTFDPIHLGHLDVARAAQRALALDRVVLLPASVPPHRAPPEASAAHRFAMAAIAALGEPGLVVSDLEIVAAGPSYTARTLDRLEARGLDTRALFFITGADAFVDIASWKDYPALLDRCRFVVVSRGDRAASRMPAALPALALRMVPAPLDGSAAVPADPSVFLVDAPTAAVSSTEVRRRAREGRPLDGLVPAAVAAHITAHRLYDGGDVLA